jgi:hypothetical protein
MSFILRITETCKLFIGSFKNAYDLQFLITNQIGVIINCTLENPNFYEAEGKIKYLKLNLADSEGEPLLTHLDNCVKFVVDSLGNGNLLVHC